MARIQGLTGGLSGKMGSAVFRQSRGQTIVSQYQPHVNNPKTEAQSEARAKFKLMSQLAAVMQSGYGTMSVNDRPARGRETSRNRFVQLNHKLVTTSKSTEGIVASIPMEQLQLTSSFRTLQARLERLNITEGNLQGDILVLNTDVVSLRVVIVSYTRGQDPQPYVQDVLYLTRENTTDPFVLESIGVETDVTVLAYGLIPTQGAYSEDLGNIETEDRFVSQVALNRLVLAGQAVETETVGINISIS